MKLNLKGKTEEELNLMLEEMDYYIKSETEVVNKWNNNRAELIRMLYISREWIMSYINTYPDFRKAAQDKTIFDRLYAKVCLYIVEERKDKKINKEIIQLASIILQHALRLNKGEYDDIFKKQDASEVEERRKYMYSKLVKTCSDLRDNYSAVNAADKSRDYIQEYIRLRSIIESKKASGKRI